MSHHEKETTNSQEVKVNPTEEDFARGRKFVEGLVAIKSGLEEIGVMPVDSQRYYLRDGFLMIVLPSEPIYRQTKAYKYHKDPGLSREDMVTEPFSITSLKINGLYDLTSRDILEIEGTGPTIPSEDQYEAHYWAEIYTFDPRNHQIAIINNKGSL